MRVSVQSDPFDLGREVADFAIGRADMGAIVTFTGVVRDLPDDPLEVMEIEAAAELPRPEGPPWGEPAEPARQMRLGL